MKYQLNHYASTYWFSGLTTAERASAKGVLFLNRPAQALRPTCTTAWGGSTTVSNCGGTSAAHYGWVADPGVTYCWVLHDPANLGAGNCSNGFGTKGRIWVRGVLRAASRPCFAPGPVFSAALVRGRWLAPTTSTSWCSRAATLWARAGSPFPSSRSRRPRSPMAARTARRRTGQGRATDAVVHPVPGLTQDDPGCA